LYGSLCLAMNIAGVRGDELQLKVEYFRRVWQKVLFFFPIPLPRTFWHHPTWGTSQFGNRCSCWETSAGLLTSFGESGDCCLSRWEARDVLRFISMSQPSRTQAGHCCNLLCRRISKLVHQPTLAGARGRVRLPSETSLCVRPLYRVLQKWRRG
jgi:hypothetical protein